MSRKSFLTRIASLVVVIGTCLSLLIALTRTFVLLRGDMYQISINYLDENAIKAGLSRSDAAVSLATYRCFAGRDGFLLVTRDDRWWDLSSLRFSFVVETPSADPIEQISFNFLWQVPSVALRDPEAALPTLAYEASPFSTTKKRFHYLFWPGWVTICGGLVCTLLLTLPKISASVRRWVRHGRGQCLVCGYSLQGLSFPAAGCPECGAAGKVVELARK